jgi:tight adherence protein B
MAQEIDLALRQHRVGVPLEEALREIGTRTGSQNLDAAVTAIAIARTSGGNLPAVLEETAGVLRERMRLDAFIDAKTAEGKAQAWVMGLLPVLMSGILYYMDPNWLKPLFEDPYGWIILGVAVLCEILGVYWVRKVTRIDA